MLPCLCSPLSFVKMTQKLLGSVALPWSTSHGQHMWWIDLWFHWKMPTGVDLHSWFLIHTRPLLGSSFHLHKYKCRAVKALTKPSLWQQDNSGLAFQEQQNCLRVFVNYRLPLSFQFILQATSQTTNQRKTYLWWEEAPAMIKHGCCIQGKFREGWAKSSSVWAPQTVQ